MARILGKLAIGGTIALAGLLVAVPALAYSVGPGSFATAPATVTPGVPFTFSVTFIQPDGTPFPAGVPVVFSFSGGGGTVTLTGTATGAGNSGSVSAVVTVVAGTGAVTTEPAGVHLTAAVIPAQGCNVTFDPTSTSTDSSGTASTTATVSAGCAAAPSAAVPSAALPSTGAYSGSGPTWMGPAGFGGGAALLIVLVGFMVWRQRRTSRKNEA